MASNKPAPAKKTKPEAVQLEDRYEFIPYHSHYNPHTLITKNGELLQVIKIDGNLRGKPCENLDGVHDLVCNAIRRAIVQSEINEKFSFWLHTVRKRNPTAYNSPDVVDNAPDNFVAYVNSWWEKENHWEYYYQNEIYLTILYEGQAIPLFNGKHIKNLALPWLNRRFCNKYLDNTYPLLDRLSLSILELLNSECMAKRLSLSERVMSAAGKVARPPVFCSEIMEFLGTLINLRSETFPLPDVDLSVGLQTTQLSFGFNAIEAASKKTGKRRFATMLSLKQYLDMPIDSVDCVLQAQMELVISQSFTFIPAEHALKNYKSQKAFFNGSGDIKANDDFGVNLMLNSDHGSPVDFGEYQTSIMILVDDLHQLDGEVGKFQKEFSKLGLVTVREDIMMEECFLAQLPGNFEFIRRRNFIATERIGGFCRLNRFHSGVSTGVHWGNFLSLIPTNVNSPYCFNFHVQDNGHTVLFDFNSFDDRIGQILEYFLLTETRKFNARMFVFDRNQSARLLFNKLGGSYFPMTQLEKVNRDKSVDRSPRLALNPFALPPSNYNNSFLVAWCGLLISPDTPPDETARLVLREAIEKVYNLPPTERNLAQMVSLVAQSDPALAQPLERWIGKGEYAGLFDFAQDSLDIGVDMVGFDMTSAIAKPAFALPLFSYLMHRVIDTIDGTPTVIVMNEAWDLLENAFFAPRLESLLEMLRQKNVMVLFTTSRPSICHKTAILPAIMAGTSTQIYLSDQMPVEYQEQGIGLNKRDAFLLLDMDRQKGDFLLKQDGDSIALRVSIAEAEDVVAIFTNDLKALGSARGRFAGVPKDY